MRHGRPAAELNISRRSLSSDIGTKVAAQTHDAPGTSVEPTAPVSAYAMRRGQPTFAAVAAAGGVVVGLHLCRLRISYERPHHPRPSICADRARAAGLLAESHGLLP